MATHDYIISNGTGAAVRADLNNALAAIVSNNSNSSEPSTMYAYQWWADLSNAVMKIRNSANDGWIELFQLDGTLTLENGTVSTPALAFRNDLNTGIYRSADNTLNIATDGVERMELGTTTIFNEDGADVDFRIEGDTEANLFYVDAGNNRIGIGLSSPASTLNVHGVFETNSFAENSGAGGRSAVGLLIGDAHSAGKTGGSDDRNAIIWNERGLPIDFGTNNTIRMTLDHDGNLGINTNSPSKKLHILGANEEDLIFLATGNTGGNTFAGVRGDNEAGIRIRGGGSARGGEIDLGGGLRNSDPAVIKFSVTTGSSFTEKARLDSSGRFMLGLTSALDTTASSFNITGLTSGARIATQGTTTSANTNITEFFAHWTTNKVAGFIIKSGTDTTNKDDGSMAFFTNDGSGLAEALTILSDQKVGVNNASPTEVLHVTGNILASGTITPSSDIAFKKDVKPLTNVLDKVTQLIGINFTYKNNNEKSMGLIAQDVEKFFPELIRGEEGSKSLNYMGLTGALVEAIKELSAKVAALEAA